MRFKKPIALIIVFFFSCSLAYAGFFSKPEFKLAQRYHLDLRNTDNSFFTEKLSVEFTAYGNEDTRLFKLIPFAELRRNFKRDVWERKDLGIELGRDVFSWLYLATNASDTRRHEDYRYYRALEKTHSFEGAGVLLMHHRLLNGRLLRLNGFVMNEYFYDYGRGAGVRNEVSAGFTVPVSKCAQATFNWRHIDRIHYYDSDSIETALTLIF